MKRKKSFIILFFFLPILFFSCIPESRADLQIPIIPLPYPDLTIYYLIEGEGVLQSLNPAFSLFSGQPIILPIDLLKVTFSDVENTSNNELSYSLYYVGASKFINTTLDTLSRIARNGRSCPFYLKYSGFPNILGLEFDSLFQYGGITYIQWNDLWIKTILYYFSYQDGSTSYTFRFYYDYTSYVLVQLEEETTTNLIQSQYLKYKLLMGNVFLTAENNFLSDWNGIVNYLLGIISAVFISLIFGYFLLFITNLQISYKNTRYY